MADFFDEPRKYEYFPPKPYKVLGKSPNDIQGYDRVTGRAKFTPDFYLKDKGMLYAKSLKSPFAKGKVLSVDASAAEALPGVRLVMSFFNFPKAFHTQDIYFAGQEIAAVVAIDEETAEKAIDLIKVEYQQDRNFTLDLFEAMKPDAPIVHAGRTSNISVHAAPFWTGKQANGLWAKRVTGDYGGYGDIEQGFRESDVIVETPDLHYPNTKQPSPNGRALLADWKTGEYNQTLEIYARSKGHYDIRNPWATYAELPQSKVKVIAPFAEFMGGMAGSMDAELGNVCEFGGRIAISASKALNKPVRVAYNFWEEHMWSWSKSSLGRIKLGFKSDGTLHAMDHYELVESGSYDASSVASSERAGALLGYQHNCQHMRIYHARVATNRLKARDFCGIGTSPSNYHVAWAMDKAAEVLKMDPIELMKKNTIRKGNADLHWGVPLAYLDNDGHNESLDLCAQEANWASKWGGWGAPKTKTGEIRHGIGVALKTHTGGAWAGSSLLLKMAPDGSVHCVFAMGDSGQNEPTSTAVQVAEILGIPYQKISMTRDTSDLPYVLNLGGSTGTWNTGWAAWGAACDLREKVLKLAATTTVLKTSNINDLDMDGDGVFLRSDPTKRQTYTQVFARYPVAGAREVCGYAYRRDPNGLAIPRERGAAIWELDVDTETGRIFNRKAVSANCMGLMLHPKICESQTDMGICHGGIAIFTDSITDQATGKNLTFSPIYTNKDTIMDCGLIGKGLIPFDKEGGKAHPFGANPASEGQPNPHLGAIANALYNATGVRFPHGPYTPDKVLKALGKI